MRYHENSFGELSKCTKSSLTHGHIYISIRGWFNIKMSFYQSRNSYYGDKTILWLSYLHNGISYTGKMTSLYGIKAMIIGKHHADPALTTVSHEMILHNVYFNIHIQLQTFYQRIEAEWCIYASVSYVIIGSDNGLLPNRHQAIIWTNAGILLTGPLWKNFSEILIKIHKFSWKKMHWKCRLQNRVYFVSAPMC